MKRIIIAFLLFAGIQAGAQAPANLDTSIIRTGISLQNQDWAILLDGIGSSPDSARIVASRRIRAKIQATAQKTFTTVVSVDSLPGSVVVEFYRLINLAPAGMVASRFTAITTAINAKTALSPWLSQVDVMVAAMYLRSRNRGKMIAIDN